MSTTTKKLAPIFTTNAKSDAAPTMDQLKQENAELKKENADLKLQNQKLETQVTNLKKRKAEDSSSNNANNKKLKTPAQLRKLFEKWSKALKRESAKHKLMNNFSGPDIYTVTVKESTPWTMDEFHHLFEGKGAKKVQPTPDNKPTSQTTILDFTVEQAQELFGGQEMLPSEGYEVQLWRTRNFAKSIHRGNGPAEFCGLRVQYNKSKQTLQLNFHLTFLPDENF